MNLNSRNSKCKICRSPFREQIDRMIVEGRPYSEIIAAFPQLNLNKQNISNHKKHILPEVFEEANRRYQEHVHGLANEVVDELAILDEIIAKAYRIFSSFDSNTKPRCIEVWTNALLRAIKLKSELVKVEDPVRKLVEDLFNFRDEEVIEVETFR